ncbi:putative ribonuclease H-like domain-containing protein [Tanacetum coccineum]
MDLETAQTNTTAKLPLLKQGEYDMFPVTSNEKIQQKNDVKERSHVTEGDSNEHLLTINHTRIQDLIAAIPNTIWWHQKNCKIHEDDLEEMDLKWQLALLSIKTRKFFQKTSRKITINGSNTAGYDKSKVECFNYHKLGHFARECRGPTNQDNMSINQDSSKRTINMEETSSKAILAIDGASFDWSFMADEEVPTDMALMAFLDSEVHNDKTCSKTYLKSFETLKTQLDDLRIEFNKFEFNLATYKRGLASVEEQLVFYKKNEVLFCEQLAVLKRDISYKHSEISVLKKVLNKKKPHLSLKGYGPKTKRELVKTHSNEVRESPNASLVKELVSNDKLEKKTIFPTVAKINFVRPQQQEKLVRKPVKYAEMYSFDHVQANCNYHQKERMVSGNNYTRVNYNYSDKKAHPSAHRNIVPRAVLMKTGLRPLNTNRPVNTAHPKTTVYSARPMLKAVNTARPNTGVVNAVRANQHVDTKMNSVLFIETGCFVLSPDFKLADESQVLLKVSRKNNIYSVDMKNIVPKEILTCLVAKATLDESMLWHRRIGHVNFKTINKLVKDNLVKGLPIKRFENDQTCVACLKGKQHKASYYILMPLWKYGSLFDSSLNNTSNDEPQPSSDAGKKDDESGIDDQEKPKTFTQMLNVLGPNINTASINTGSININTTSPPVTTAPLEATYADFFSDETELDMSNITNTYLVPTTPNTRIHKDHSLDHVIGNIQSGVQTRRMTRNKKDKRGIVIRNKARLVIQGYTQEKGIDYGEVFALVTRIEEIRLFLACTSFKDFVVYQMDVKNAFLYGKIEEEVYVYQPLGFEDLEFPEKVYKVEKTLYGLHQALKACQDKYVEEILKKFGFSTVKTTSTPMETSKPLLKDSEAEDVINQVKPKSFQHLHAYDEKLYILERNPQKRGDSISWDNVSWHVRSKQSSTLLLKKHIIEVKNRRHLQLADVDGISVLSTTEIFDQLSLMGEHTPLFLSMLAIQAKEGEGSKHPSEPQPPPSTAQHTNEEPILSVPIPNVPDEAVYEEWDDRVERATNIATSLDAEQASDDEEDSEDSSKQERMIEEIDQDAGVTLVTPTQGEDQPEDQLGVLSAAKVLTDAAKINVHTYTRRRMAFSTAGMIQEVNISIPSPVVVKDKGKGKMEESKDDQTKRTKLQQEQERLSYEVAVRLQEELDEEERQRMARVHEAAQSFTKEEWENIRVRVEANEELSKRLQAEEMNKYSEVDQAKMLVDLINQRKKYFTAQKSNVNTFVPMETEDRGRASELATGSSQAIIIDSAEVGSSKRVAEAELDHEGSKRQKPNKASGSVQEQPKKR